ETLRTFGLNPKAIRDMIPVFDVPKGTPSFTVTVEFSGVIDVPELDALANTTALTSLKDPQGNERYGVGRLGPYNTEGVTPLGATAQQRVIDDDTYEFTINNASQESVFAGPNIFTGLKSSTLFDLTSLPDETLKLARITGVIPEGVKVNLALEDSSTLKLNQLMTQIDSTHGVLSITGETLRTFGLNPKAIRDMIPVFDVPKGTPSFTVTVEFSGVIDVPELTASPTGTLTDFTGTFVGPGRLDGGVNSEQDDFSGVITRFDQPDQNTVIYGVDLSLEEGNPLKQFGGVIFYTGPIPESADLKLKNRYFNAFDNDIVFKLSGAENVRLSITDDKQEGTVIVDGAVKPKYRAASFEFTGISASNSYVIVTDDDLLRAVRDFDVFHITSITVGSNIENAGLEPKTITVESMGLEFIPIIDLSLSPSVEVVRAEVRKGLELMPTRSVPLVRAEVREHHFENLSEVKRELIQRWNKILAQNPNVPKPIADSDFWTDGFLMIGHYDKVSKHNWAKETDRFKGQNPLNPNPPDYLPVVRPDWIFNPEKAKQLIFGFPINNEAWRILLAGDAQLEYESLLIPDRDVHLVLTDYKANLDLLTFHRKTRLNGYINLWGMGSLQRLHDHVVVHKLPIFSLPVQPLPFQLSDVRISELGNYTASTIVYESEDDVRLADLMVKTAEELMQRQIPSQVFLTAGRVIFVLRNGIPDELQNLERTWFDSLYVTGQFIGGVVGYPDEVLSRIISQYGTISEFYNRILPRLSQPKVIRDQILHATTLRAEVRKVASELPAASSLEAELSAAIASKEDFEFRVRMIENQSNPEALERLDRLIQNAIVTEFEGAGLVPTRPATSSGRPILITRWASINNVSVLKQMIDQLPENGRLIFSVPEEQWVKAQAVRSELSKFDSSLAERVKVERLGLKDLVDRTMKEIGATRQSSRQLIAPREVLNTRFIVPIV
ncbi:MAG: hypothetical protein HY583_02900, partial [Candidatus Omnitrophica bacterium]|nr:hypothetical protein [Candidatus Omnitrophota bacterium]